MREPVQRAEGNVERARRSVVDSQDVDGSAVVRQLPARSAGSAVPAADGSCTSNVRKVWEGTKGREACTDKYW